MSRIIEVDGLTKAYDPSTRVVDRASFSVGEGEVFSLLGPNGAGKTTTIQMLTTLTAITEGTAAVGGHDVRKDPKAVRGIIGVVPQEVTLDNELKGIENLLLAAKLQHVPDSTAKKRAADLLQLVELEGYADKRVGTYSGGMKRRLQLVAALVHTPKVLFLDEPTVGLDIQTRTKIWDYISYLNGEQGVAIFMTTHYLEEADRLSDVVAIMDRGSIKIAGTPGELKDSLRGDVLTITLEDGAQDLTGFLNSFPTVTEVTRAGDSYRLKIPRAESALPQIITSVSSRGLKITGTSFSKPTLDQVFLEVTGRSMRDAEEGNGRADKFADIHVRESR
ncbi:MAG: ATP-binding cassette domain-containing protein [Nitrososphaerota archaeon]|nr:ATP-binding cassette domain-containing protein [Nitrososphaerota archaeon]MDG7024885.1 ATP-binding cassette domain-containing protein [Nitrososphaerota archaeon]